MIFFWVIFKENGLNFNKEKFIFIFSNYWLCGIAEK